MRMRLANGQSAGRRDASRRTARPSPPLTTPMGPGAGRARASARRPFQCGEGGRARARGVARALAVACANGPLARRCRDALAPMHLAAWAPAIRFRLHAGRLRRADRARSMCSAGCGFRSRARAGRAAVRWSVLPPLNARLTWACRRRPPARSPRAGAGLAGYCRGRWRPVTRA